MARYQQTLGRIGAGLSAMGALSWLLLTANGWSFDKEPMFVFCTTLGVWLTTEFKLSEEVIYRGSTKNDVRLGREILAYHTNLFSDPLRDHDYHNGLHPRLLSEINLLLTDHERGAFRFQDKKVRIHCEDFMTRLSEFAWYLAKHSSYEQYGQRWVQAIVPSDQRSDYDLDPRFKEEIAETHRLAKQAWVELEKVAQIVHERIPETLDEPLPSPWFRSQPE